MKNFPALPAIFTAVALITWMPRSTAAPQVSFFGGGTNGGSLFMSLSEDITWTVKSGMAVSGYGWGLQLPSTDDFFASVFIQPTTAISQTSEALIQTNAGSPVVSLDTITTFSAYAGSQITLAFTKSYQEFLLTNGGSITFTKGTYQIDNNSGNIAVLGYYVLKQQNLTFDLGASNIWGNSEAQPGFNAANLEIVPESSTYALFGLGALVLVVAYRRRVA